ncbi:MAG: hypothetical protein A6F71_05520 [Cycloclasticus sp. symbiont of Poecilosclerida sp. M]|nr:MAG: hypothetical protein A6F71_05520 [Cycloclasticus sp. symbiont of Poecilosclerida sp. M]
MDLQQKKEIIIDFLKKCNAYGDGMLDKYQRQLSEVNANTGALKDKMRDWDTHKTFNQVAIDELKTNELDDWFDESQ